MDADLSPMIAVEMLKITRQMSRKAVEAKVNKAVAGLLCERDRRKGDCCAECNVVIYSRDKFVSCRCDQ